MHSCPRIAPDGEFSVPCLGDSGVDEPKSTPEGNLSLDDVEFLLDQLHAARGLGRCLHACS